MYINYNRKEAGIMSSDFIPEADVNIDTLTALYKRAFYKCDKDEDGDLRVNTDGPRVLITVNEENKLVRFTAIYRFKENEPEDKKLHFINRMNDKFIFARFSMPELDHDVLVADYYLPYEDGLPAFQLIKALRTFANIVVAGIRACDEDGLVG